MKTVMCQVDNIHSRRSFVRSSTEFEKEKEKTQEQIGVFNRLAKISNFDISNEPVAVEHCSLISTKH